jgi:hypothetical protein
MKLVNVWIQDVYYCSTFKVCVRMYYALNSKVIQFQFPVGISISGFSQARFNRSQK